MKDEEMAEERKADYGIDLCCLCRECEVENIIPCQHKKDAMYGYKDGFLAGLKAGRPQWHKVADGDLPKDDENFICMLENGYRLECYYDPTSKRWYDNFSHHDIEYGYYQSKVLAWCEIPTFDKE